MTQKRLWVLQVRSNVYLSSQIRQMQMSLLSPSSIFDCEFLGSNKSIESNESFDSSTLFKSESVKSNKSNQSNKSFYPSTLFQS